MRLGLFSTTMFFGLATLAPLSASANITAHWVLSGADSGSGTMILGNPDNGGYDIASLTGTIDGFSVSLLGGDPGWLPGPPNSNTPPGVTAAPAYSAYGLTFDNILYPAGDSPDIPCFGPTTTRSNQFADAYGILFSFGGNEGEIWGNGTHGDYIFGPPGLYTFEVATGIATPADLSAIPPVLQTPVVGYYQNVDAFQVSVPEPSTWAMMLLGFAGLGFAGYRRARLAA